MFIDFLEMSAKYIRKYLLADARKDWEKKKLNNTMASGNHLGIPTSPAYFKMKVEKLFGKGWNVPHIREMFDEN